MNPTNTQDDKPRMTNPDDLARAVELDALLVKAMEMRGAIRFKRGSFSIADRKEINRLILTMERLLAAPQPQGPGYTDEPDFVTEARERLRRVIPALDGGDMGWAEVGRARAIVAAFEAGRATLPPAPSVSEWQDISTAPTGEHILLFFPNGERGVGGMEAATVYRNKGALDSGAWTHGGPNSGSDFEFCEPPTHWRPLPPPPLSGDGL